MFSQKVDGSDDAVARAEPWYIDIDYKMYIARSNEKPQISTRISLGRSKNLMRAASIVAVVVWLGVGSCENEEKSKLCFSESCTVINLGDHILQNTALQPLPTSRCLCLGT